ncbi:MAG: DUF418 domain-containing protein [Lysobacteraceae bacterium]
MTTIEPTAAPATTGDSTVDTPLRPVAGAQRIDAMDVLRGFALIGILMMNIEWFNRPIAQLGSIDYDLLGIDYAAGLFVNIFVQGKFYKLFSLLFGMGFAIMLGRARERGQPFTAVFLRRMLGLWLFGMAHLVFFWGGDILHDYAFGGLLLLGWIWLLDRRPMQRFNNPASILRFSLIFMAFPFIVMTIASTVYLMSHDTSKLREGWEEKQLVVEQSDALYEQAKADGVDLTAEDEEETKDDESAVAADTAGGEEAEAADDVGSADAVAAADTDAADATGDDDDTEEQSDEERIAEKAEQRAKGLAWRDKASDEERAAVTDPSYGVMLAYLAKDSLSHLARTPFFAGMILFPIFTLGYWLVSTGRMRHTEQHRGFFKALMYVGIGLGLPMTLAAIAVNAHPAARWVDELRNAGGGLFQIGQYVLAAGYLGLVVTMLHTRFWRRPLLWLAPLGRMALTNYLMHTLILSTIFFGFGFGQFGNIPRGQQMLIVVAIIAFQWVFSTLWLKAFRFGPLEWLWRCFTYWQWQPLRRAAA